MTARPESEEVVRLLGAYARRMRREGFEETSSDAMHLAQTRPWAQPRRASDADLRIDYRWVLVLEESGAARLPVVADYLRPGAG